MSWKKEEFKVGDKCRFCGFKFDLEDEESYIEDHQWIASEEFTIIRITPFTSGEKTVEYYIEWDDNFAYLYDGELTHA